MKIIILLLFMSILQSCTISPPFAGPGYDSKTKKLKYPADQKVILALTNATLYDRKRKGFDQSTRDIYRKIESHSGYIAGTIRMELFGDEVWTMTVWESREDLKRFVDSRKHLDAIYMTHDALNSFRTLNIEVAASELPYTWDKVEELLMTKLSKKHNPSELD